MRRDAPGFARWVTVIVAGGLAVVLWAAVGGLPESLVAVSAKGNPGSSGAGAAAVMSGDRNGNDGNDDDSAGADDEAEVEFDGILVTRPVPPTLEGVWTFIVEDSTTITVVATATTRFGEDLAQTTAGGWLEVKGTRQLDGSILADRIRVDDYEVGELVVRLESAAYSMTLASRYGLTLTSTLLKDANIYLYSTLDDDEPTRASQIAQDDRVVWAEVNYVNAVPEDDGYRSWGWGGADEPGGYGGQSAFTQVNLSEAARAFDGSGIVVAVLDTGVYSAHEQFVGRLQLPSLDVIDDDIDASEVGPGLAWGHGTHVAGIVAAMAPQATLLPVRVLDQNGRGNTFLLAYAIEWAVSQGADVINMSLGTDFDSEVLRDVVAKAVADGVVLVAAVGNGGSPNKQFPAAYDGVISVTAVDQNNVKAAFANYGAGWVDLAAPGVGIRSTMITAEGAGYANWSGTSMSTAFASGAAAQLRGKPAAAVVGVSIHDHLWATGTDIDAANNAMYAGQIGHLLNVSRALGVDDVAPGQVWMYLPQMQR